MYWAGLKGCLSDNTTKVRQYCVLLRQYCVLDEHPDAIYCISVNNSESPLVLRSTPSVLRFIPFSTAF
jgi:hypothetical protein